MKWNSIETFFLDMDGTLLDLAYDNYFWHEHIPNLYAKKNSITYKKAKKKIEIMYKNKKNTIEWYSLDYWSEILEINLKTELFNTKNKIKIFPGSIEFLRKLKEQKIKIILLTNCPRQMLNIKLTQTKLWGFFDKIISSEDYGFAKETNEFWYNLKKNIVFKIDSSVFIDDNQNVLDFSYKNGIKNIFCINVPDSKKDKQVIKEYKSIDSISSFEREIIN